MRPSAGALARCRRRRGRGESPIPYSLRSIFAFSAASRRRCLIIGSALTSIPELSLNSSISQSTSRASMSVPPRWLFPAVARTRRCPCRRRELRCRRYLRRSRRPRWWTVSRAGRRRRGPQRLAVDDSEHIESSNLAGVLGGLTLSIVEVGRHRDDGLGHRLTRSPRRPSLPSQNEAETTGAVVIAIGMTMSSPSLSTGKATRRCPRWLPPRSAR